MSDAGPTVVDALLERARARPDEPAFTYLGNGREVTDSLTRGALVTCARAIAGSLRARGVEGAVVVSVPPDLDFVRILFGLVLAGNPAIPVSPKGPKEGVGAYGRAVTAAVQAGAGTICVASEDVDELQSLLDGRTDLATPIRVVAAGDLVAAPPAPDGALDRPGPDGLAFVQFTSGSTGNPRGVAVPHRALLHNLRLIERHLALGDGVVGVMWTPPTHDLGLVGGLFGTAFSGAHLVCLPPIAFLHRPASWLRAIDAFGAEVSAAPDFGYALAARRGVRDGVPLDLSRWRVAITGAEPIRGDTMRRFADVFRPHGFSPSAVMPIYGLAETTLVATAGPAGEGPTSVVADRDALAAGRFRPAAGDAPGREVVGVGWTPDPEGEVLVVDPGTRRPAPSGQVGEIWLRSPSLAVGYVNDDDATAERFRARLATAEGDTPHLRTGDAGFVDDGQLFITGRMVDTIIVNGRNLDPHDVEESIRGALALVHTDTCGAVQVDDGLVVVVEVTPTRMGDDALARARAAVARDQGVTLHRLWSCPRGAIPKTPSGKVRRTQLRHLVEVGRTESWADLA